MTVAQDVIQAGHFLQEQLKIYDRNIIETVYPEYWGFEGQYHNAVGDLPIAAQKIIDSRMDLTGKAVNYNGKGTVLPLANYGIAMDEYKVEIGILAAEWSWMELQAQEMAQRNPFLPVNNVVENYRKAMDKGLREWMHLRTVFGDPNNGFMGLVNNAYVEVFDVSSTFAPYSSTATADSNYDFIRLLISNFRKTSKLTVQNVSMLACEDLHAALTKRFTNNTSDGNPLKLLLSDGTAPSLGAFNVVNEFDNASLQAAGLTGTFPGTNKDFFMVYEQAADTIDRHFSPIQTLPAQLLDDMITYRTVGMCATSEVRVRQPFRVRYYVYSNSTS